MHKNLLLLLLSAMLSLFIAEWIITWLTIDPGYFEASKRGLHYDTRDRLEVILDNRRIDLNWYPAVPANTYLEHNIYLNGKRIIPLAGIAHAKVVGCNENGYYNTFRTDEIGFRNPTGTWPLKPGKYIYLVGDSFAQGDCVNDEDTVAGIIRRHYPYLINLGVGGNGPLLELATMREYIQDQQVSYVFWLYYEGNDLGDIQRDYRDALLRRYLEPDFKQSLLAQQDLVNSVVRAAIEQRIMNQASGRPIIFPQLRKFIWSMRHKLGAQHKENPLDQHSSLDLFWKVVKLARDEVHKKGGELVFVYLPEYNRLTGDTTSQYANQRDPVLRMLSELNIPVVDAQKVLLSHNTPASLLPFGLKGRHYTAEGYALVANTIIQFLRSRHAAPASDAIARP